jgi:hypothetical protein
VLQEEAKEGRCLINTFVQAADWKFYENPVCIGVGWCFRILHGKPIMAVGRIKTTTKISARKRIRGILRHAGFEARMGEYYEGKQLFPPHKKLRDAAWIELELIAPIPKPDFYESEVDTPAVMSYFLAWRMSFPKSVLDDAMSSARPVDRMLSDFLTNCGPVAHQGWVGNWLDKHPGVLSDDKISVTLEKPIEKLGRNYNYMAFGITKESG